MALLQFPVGGSIGDTAAADKLRSNPPPPAPRVRAMPFSEQEWVLFPQLLEPSPTLSFISTPLPPGQRLREGMR